MPGAAYFESLNVGPSTSETFDKPAGDTSKAFQAARTGIPKESLTQQQRRKVLCHINKLRREFGQVNVSCSSSTRKIRRTCVR